MNKNKLVNMNSWFICSNCNDKFYVVNGCFTLDNRSFFCEDCIQDMNEELEKQDALELLKVD